MDEGAMAEVIGDALNEPECWTAIGYDLGEVHFTNEYGEKFVLTVEAVDVFPGEEDDGGN